MPSQCRPMPYVAETDDRFYIAASTIPGAGAGVFARVALVGGDCLQVIGVLVPAESVSDACSHFADHHKFRVGDHVLVPLGYGGIANHSLDPNMERIVEGDAVYLRALRAIDVGEEITHCYQQSARDRMGLP